MNRKWAVMVAAALSAAFLGTGLTLADDEDSPLHKVMEKVHANNSLITKGVRNAAMFKKSQEQVAKAAGEMVKLAKESKPLNDVAKNTKLEGKDSLKAWDMYSDDFIKESEAFEKVVTKAGVDHATAKSAFTKLGKSCSACHDDFRKEDE